MVHPQRKAGFTGMTLLAAPLRQDVESVKVSDELGRGGCPRRQ